MPIQMDESLRDAAIERRTRFWGKYRGIVTDVLGGSDLGKITVQVPEIYGQGVTMTAWPCVPFAGPSHGFVAVPEVGDGVWIEFEGGNPSQPIWVGCWWAQGDIPAPSDTNVRTWITSNGLKIILDDGQSQLSLQHPQGASIVLTGTEITLSIGATSLKLDASGIKTSGNVQVGA